VNRASALASRQVQIDVATFIQWVNAHAEHRDALAGFYRARFRNEFKPVFAAWLATRPFENPAAPPTPFAMPGFRLKADEEAAALEAAAAGASQHAKDANRHADDYMLAVVLVASALFFFGMGTKLESSTARFALLGFGSVVFLAAVIWIANLPVQLTT
jgi:hypothetical protein